MGSVIRLRSDALSWLEIDGEIVALDQGHSMYVSVNRTGAVLWPALQAGATRAELVALLVEEFGIDASIAGDDIDAFVATLAGRDLLLPAD